MATQIGINGFGRIGRQVTRAILERYAGELEIVAINDLADAHTNAHLFKYDSNYGIYPGSVQAMDGLMLINDHKIKVLSEREPGQLPWGALGVDIVIESTGRFTDADKAIAHIQAGAKKVIISAPAKGEDATLVLGVNHETYNADQHRVLSNASCTTNCVAMLIKVLHDNFGIRRGLMSTIHAYTNDQQILDQVHSDLRRARSAAQNIIPTSTGAAKAVGLVLPELDGKLHGMAFRVPVPTGSITDFVAELSVPVTVDEINAAYKSAADGSLKGYLEYTEAPIVSSDIKMNPNSCIFDAGSTLVMDSTLVKVLGWYDNEWGYACRTADLTALLVQKGL